MIAALIGAVLGFVIVWLVDYVREGRAITRALKADPGIIDPTPPTSAELRGIDFLIPEDARAHAAKLGKQIVAGDSPPTDTSLLWYDGPLLEEVEPAKPYDGPIKALMSPYEVMVPAQRYATGGPVKGGIVWFNEYSDYRIATGPRTTLVGPDRKPVAAKPEVGTQYYEGRGRLDRLIADPAVSIHDVVREVERLCDRDQHAAKYYRDNPDLNYVGHPWMQFVAAGHAAYLGWEPGEGEP